MKRVKTSRGGLRRRRRCSARMMVMLVLLDVCKEGKIYNYWENVL